LIGNAIHVMRIATGEIEETKTEDGKNAAAVALGRIGGKARAKGMTSEKRRAIASWLRSDPTLVTSWVTMR